VKKISVAIVQGVPSVFSDEEMEDEPRRLGFFSCFCCELRFRVHRACTQSSENELLMLELFSDITPEAQAAPDKPVAIASFKAKTSKSLATDDEASLKFAEDLRILL
jgi:hypothetical protein